MNRRIKYTNQAGRFLLSASKSDSKKLKGIIASLGNVIIGNGARHYSYFDVGCFRIIFKITPKTAFVMLISRRTDPDMYRLLGLKPVMVSETALNQIRV